MDWKDYQEQSAAFFRSLGLEADTDIEIEGARTKHKIDVLVKSHHAGFDVTWIVECKHWNSKVSKVHVLALREIVNDTGADRGILLAEKGFQSGAIEAASLTNVRVTSLAEIESLASYEICAMRLRDLHDLLMWCKEEYWNIDKKHRIDCGLRPQSGGASVGYSGDVAIRASEEMILNGLGGRFPFKVDELFYVISKTTIEQELPAEIKTMEELMHLVAPIVTNLESKIIACKNRPRS